LVVSRKTGNFRPTSDFIEPMKFSFPHLVLLALWLGACQTKTTAEQTRDSTVMDVDATAPEASGVQPDTPNDPAAVSTSASASAVPSAADRMRQLAGTYEGTLPCADCEGIKASLTLDAGGSYTLEREYLGKGDRKPARDEGRWQADSVGVTLLGNTADANTRYRATDPRTLTMLGRDGRDVESKLNYSLTKK